MSEVPKRQRIMQAAEKLFATRRLHEITLDEIVREAHIGKGTIYTYFKDKDDLFFQVATGGFAELVDLLEQRVAEDAPFAMQLEQACRAISAFFRNRRQLFRMIQTEDARMCLLPGRLHDRWVERRQQLVRALARILRKGQGDGLVRQDFSEETLAELLLGMLRSRGRNLPDAGAQVSDQSLVDLFVNGAGPAGRSGRRPNSGRKPKLRRPPHEAKP